MSPILKTTVFFFHKKNALCVLFHLTELEVTSHSILADYNLTSSSSLLCVEGRPRPPPPTQPPKKPLILNMYWPEQRPKGVWQILIITDDHNAWNSFLRLWKQ